MPFEYKTNVRNFSEIIINWERERERAERGGMGGAKRESERQIYEKAYMQHAWYEEVN